MKVLQIEQHIIDPVEAIKSLKVVEKPIPEPKHGQVLIKMKAAPCNPSDVLFLQGLYGVTKTMPAVPGWEGAGEVVKSGGGFKAWMLQGKRAAFAGQKDADGTWAEYYIADADSCIPLKAEVSYAQGASLLINPLTAYGLVEQAIRGNHRGIVQTAAASQLGRMVNKICIDKNIPLINILRREEQCELLRSLGASVTLNSESPDFEDQLRAEVKKHHATIGFDAVGGAMSGTVLNALDEGGKVLVYGALSGDACGELSPLELIFKNKGLEGFWLTSWMKSAGSIGLLRATNYVQRSMVNVIFATAINKEVSLEQAPEAILEYCQSMTSGKVLITHDS